MQALRLHTLTAHMQVGRVITISKASLKPRNPKFNTTPHEFEVYLDRGSTLAVVDDHDPDVAAIPRIIFNVSSSCSTARPHALDASSDGCSSSCTHRLAAHADALLPTIR